MVGAGLPSNKPVDVQTMLMSLRVDGGARLKLLLSSTMLLVGVLLNPDGGTALRQAAEMNETDTDVK